MEKQQIALRLPPDLVKAIDARAKKHKLSRNEWCEKALARVVEMPSQVETKSKRF